MGDDFDIPVSRIKDIKFFKDDIKELHLSEYKTAIEPIGNRGHEFALKIEEKINTPLFDYPTIIGGLNVYMPKSQYTKLLNQFVKIGNVDQYEYISVKTNNIEKVQKSINNLSLEYFKKDDYFIESKLDEEVLVKKRNVIGSVLAIFFSIFFIIVGFSNCYFSFYNLFLKRQDEFLLYKAIGIDKSLLKSILNREKKKILLSFISTVPFIILIVSYVVSKVTKIFTPIDILLNLNILFVIVILGYILIIHISISKIYDKYMKETIGS